MLHGLIILHNYQRWKSQNMCVWKHPNVQKGKHKKWVFVESPFEVN